MKRFALQPNYGLTNEQDFSSTFTMDFAMNRFALSLTMDEPVKRFGLQPYYGLTNEQVCSIPYYGQTEQVCSKPYYGLTNK